MSLHLCYSNGYGKIFTKEMSEELERIAMTYRKDAMDPDINDTQWIDC